METSAKEDTNVQDIFIKLSKPLLFSTLLVLQSVCVGSRLPSPQAPDAGVVRAGAKDVRNARQNQSKGGCC